MLETALRYAYELNLTCNYSQWKNHQFLLQKRQLLPRSLKSEGRAKQGGKAKPEPLCFSAL